MLLGLHHTDNVRPLRAVVSAILVGLLKLLANAGVEYMVSRFESCLVAGARTLIDFVAI